MSQLFSWGGQSTGVSALASFLPKKSQGCSPSEWTGWISLQSKGLSRVFSNTTVQKHQVPFDSFSCLIAVARTHNVMLNKSGKSGHPCPVPDFSRNAFSFSPLNMTLAVVCHLWFLLCWDMFPLCPLSGEFLSKMDVEFYQKLFFFPITDSMDMSLSKLRELVMDREASRAASMGSQRVRHNWATDLNWLRWPCGFYSSVY